MSTILSPATSASISPEYFFYGAQAVLTVIGIIEVRNAIRDIRIYGISIATTTTVSYIPK